MALQQSKEELGRVVGERTFSIVVNVNTLLDFFVKRVHGFYFSSFPIYYSADGTFFGEFMKNRVETRFEVVGPDMAIAQTFCTTPTHIPLELETLLKLCRTSQSPVVLDRFVRAIHLLNFMEQNTPWEKLFLPVSFTLIAGVDTDHGKVFRDILNRLELNHQFGILLPQALANSPDKLEQICRNYHKNGFITALPSTDGDKLRVITH